MAGIEPASSGWKPEVIAIIRHPREGDYRQTFEVLKGIRSKERFCDYSFHFLIGRLRPRVAGDDSFRDQRDRDRIAAFSQRRDRVFRAGRFVAAISVGIEVSKPAVIGRNRALVEAHQRDGKRCGEQRNGCQCFAQSGNHAVGLSIIPHLS